MLTLQIFAGILILTSEINLGLIVSVMKNPLLHVKAHRLD